MSPMTMKSTAPSPAPDETPTSPGPASGLRKRPCSTAPETARPAPISAPISIRGKRMSNSTIWSRSSACVPLPSRESAAPTTSIRVAPTNRLPAITTSVTTARPTSAARARCERSPARSIGTALVVASSTSVARRLGIELMDEIEQRGGRARPEAEEVRAIHVDQRLVLAGRGLRQRGACEHGVAGGGVIAGVGHHQDHVGLGGDDRLVVQELVALVVGNRIGGA